MKILITGSTGFIGNKLINHLIPTNKHEIIATSTNKEKAKTFAWYKDVNYIQANLQDKISDYYSFFDKPDILIHLAWKGLPNYNSEHHITENLEADYYFLSNIIINGLKNITISGTCMEYGLQEGKLIETMPSSPTMPYSIAKNSLRLKLEALNKTENFSLKWLRLFYMYGQGQNPNSLFAQLDAAILRGDNSFNMSKGEQIRDYLTVENMVEKIAGISMQTKVTGIINCCSGKGVKIKDLVNEYLIKKDAKINLNLGYYPYPSYEPFEFWGDNTKLNQALSSNE